ncbi:MAG: restriction endonuclease [Anaerolineae bacterium]|nr:restriction endonuclease [Anaerolineae bacterium]
MTSTELRQRLFHFATQPLPRLEARTPGGLRRARRAYRAGMLIICSLTVWLLAWLAYHWLWQPAWLQTVPELLHELIVLVETAGTFTVAFVWAGLALRHWRQMNGDPAAPAHVAAVRDSLYTLSPQQFEAYVASLFRGKGYAVMLRGGSGDHGVDLELRDRRTGRRAIVQCKRYQNTVGAETVRELYGTLLHELAYHAFLVTTADISEAARAWAQGKPMTLIDGSTLAQIDGSLRQRAARRAG